MKDFEVTVKLRNNQLKARRKELGLGIIALCQAVKISPAMYMALEGLKVSPIYETEHCAGPQRTPVKSGWQKGDWRLAALKLAKFFGCPPEELFPEDIQRVKKSEIVATFDFEQLPLAAAHAVPALMPSPEDECAAHEVRTHIESALKTLSPHEEKVLRLRYGLDDGKERTLEEIAREFGRSRERIRTIESKALKKLRHPSRTKRLADVLEQPEQAMLRREREERTEHARLETVADRHGLAVRHLREWAAARVQSAICHDEPAYTAAFSRDAPAESLQPLRLLPIETQGDVLTYLVNRGELRLLDDGRYAYAWSVPLDGPPIDDWNYTYNARRGRIVIRDDGELVAKRE